MAYTEFDFTEQKRGRILDASGNPYVPEPAPMDLPYEKTFSAIISGVSNTFLREQWDEALLNNRENALAMRRDARLMGWLRERKEGTVSRKWMLEIPDETDPVQIAVRDGMTEIVKNIPRLKRIFRWALEALWYGRYGVQLLLKETMMDLPTVTSPALFPLGNSRELMLQKHLATGGETSMGKDGKPVPKTPKAPRKVTTVIDARPVNGDKLNFLWNGTPLVAVYAGFEGNLREQGADVRSGEQLKTLKTSITWDNLSPVMLLTGAWREKFLIHTHDPDDADYFEAERAGGVHGVGIRSRIYWLNHIRQDLASFVYDFFDRFGLGFVAIHYDFSNATARAAAETMAKQWNRRACVLVPVSPDQITKGGGIEVIDVPTAGALVMQQLIEYADRHLERFILGQSMSSGESAREGLGGTVGPALMAMNTKHQLLQSDAEELEETLTGSEQEPGLCSVIQKYTYPGTIDKFRVRFRFMVDDPNPKERIDAIVSLAGAGVEFGQDSARKITGEPAPKDGEKTFGGAAAVAPVVPGQEPDPNDPDATGQQDDDMDEFDMTPGTSVNGKLNGKINGAM